MAERVSGGNAGIYRIFYILFSIVTLPPVLWYQSSLPQHAIVEPGTVIRLVQGVLLFYGILMFYLGARVYDMRFFLGISQWQNAKKNNKPALLPFHTAGVLAYVRHPWYSGGIAFIWGFGTVTDIYLLTRLILTVYFIIGTVHEERRLVIELGDAYKTYRSEVPMLIPWKLKKRKVEL
jgi:protein-S-isoprenylcysteine O-methyltransferase Ste14